MSQPWPHGRRTPARGGSSSANRGADLARILHTDGSYQTSGGTVLDAEALTAPFQQRLGLLKALGTAVRAGGPVDVKHPVNAPHRIQHMIQVLGVTHFERELGQRHTVGAGVDTGRQNIDMTLR